MKSLQNLFKDKTYLLFFFLAVLVFFFPFFLFGKIPIPADTIVGMYHPWRDEVWDGFTAGVPFKNFLITDPVRQQYVWRDLAISQLKRGQVPMWNPYAFSGTPLLANFQSAPFYPLNILFFIFPFDIAWGLLIFLEPLLAGFFLYLYLRFMKVSKAGSFIGAFSFAFSGFFISWLEWNTILHVVLWLPLILLAKEHLLKRISLNWVIILVFAEISQILGGHLQFLFYSLIISNIYLLVRIIQISKRESGSVIKHSVYKYIPFLILGIAVFIVTSIQWLPTIKFITLSSRSFDQGSFYMKEGWFIPWQHLLQFFAPDFFGNPVTQNYSGVWNWGEMIGYIGIIPLLFSFYALFFRIDSKTLFFGSLLFVSIFFALPTGIAKLPFIFRLPLISTSQPTRLIFIVDFSLSVLAALGFDQFIKDKSYKRLISILLFFIFIFILMWIVVSKPSLFQLSIDRQDISVSKRNLILPTVIISLAVVLFTAFIFVKERVMKLLIINCILLVVVFDLFRFGWKFNPFTKKEWIFPKTKLINILQKNIEQWRIMSLDRRIMPPNFATYFRLNDVSGYDPLYLQKYGQLVSSWERSEANLNKTSFNRIITPSNYEHFITDLLGVKYILNFGPIESEKLKFIASEGDTYLYENTQAFPRVFLTSEVKKVDNSSQELEEMFSLKNELIKIAVIREDVEIDLKEISEDEKANIVDYSDNYVKIETRTDTARVLVLTDIYYPTWRVYVDQEETKVFVVDFIFRGVIVPEGKHLVEYKNILL